MLAIDFDHLVADTACLYSGAFKTALLGHNCALTNTSGVRVFEAFAPCFSGLKFVTEYAKSCTDSDTVATALASRVLELIVTYCITCKPRPGSIEKLFAFTNERDSVKLVTGDTKLAQLIWSTWIGNDEKLKVLNDHCVFIDVSEFNTKADQDTKLICSPNVADHFKHLKNVEITPRLAFEEHRKRLRAFPMQKLGECELTRRAWEQRISIPLQVVQGIIVTGFQRGSTEIGVPTANVDCPLKFEPPTKSNSGTQLEATFAVPGSYIGRCVVDVEPYQQRLFGCIISIGWASYYNNQKPTLEAYIYHDFNKTFYGRRIIIEITELLRGDSSCSDFSELITAIQFDCEVGWAVYQANKQPPCEEIEQVLQHGWSPLSSTASTTSA